MITNNAIEDGVEVGEGGNERVMTSFLKFKCMMSFETFSKKII